MTNCDTPVSLLGVARQGEMDALSEPQRQALLAALWKGSGEPMEEILAREGLSDDQFRRALSTIPFDFFTSVVARFVKPQEHHHEH